MLQVDSVRNELNSLTVSEQELLVGMRGTLPPMMELGTGTLFIWQLTCKQNMLQNHFLLIYF